jgi:hypothetical protein
MSRHFALGLTGFAIVVLPLAAQSLNLRPGKYETKTYVRMPGIPPDAPPRVDATCVTPDQVTDVSKIAHARDALQTDQCKVSDTKAEGNTVSITMTCPNLTTISDYTFDGDSFSAFSRKKGAAKADWMMKVTAKRVGECTK